MGKMVMALKKLGKKLTGKTINNDNTVGVINEIADKYEGGGSGGIEYVDIDVSQTTLIDNKWEGSITNSDKEKLLNGANIKTYNLDGDYASAVCYLDTFSNTQNVYKSSMQIMLIDDDQPYFYLFERQIVEINLENNTYKVYYERTTLPTLS